MKPDLPAPPFTTETLSTLGPVRPIRPISINLPRQPQPKMNAPQEDEAPGSPWLKLAAARRQALESARLAASKISTDVDIHTDAEAEAAPFGFASRVAALAMAARRNTALSRWTLWSFRGAVASGATALLVMAASPATALPPGAGSGENVLLKPPALEMPTMGSMGGQL